MTNSLFFMSNLIKIDTNVDIKGELLPIFLITCKKRSCLLCDKW